MSGLFIFLFFILFYGDINLSISHILFFLSEIVRAVLIVLQSITRLDLTVFFAVRFAVKYPIVMFKRQGMYC